MMQEVYQKTQPSNIIERRTEFFHFASVILIVAHLHRIYRLISIAELQFVDSQRVAAILRSLAEPIAQIN
jgi:hypothetical protein